MIHFNQNPNISLCLQFNNPNTLKFNNISAKINILFKLKQKTILLIKFLSLLINNYILQKLIKTIQRFLQSDLYLARIFTLFRELLKEFN